MPNFTKFAQVYIFLAFLAHKPHIWNANLENYNKYLSRGENYNKQLSSCENYNQQLTRGSIKSHNYLAGECLVWPYLPITRSPYGWTGTPALSRGNDSSDQLDLFLCQAEPTGSISELKYFLCPAGILLFPGKPELTTVLGTRMGKLLHCKETYAQQRFLFGNIVIYLALLWKFCWLWNKPYHHHNKGYDFNICSTSTK